MSDARFPPGSLRAALAHVPQPLRFGTSGRRGEVIHLTQLEVYLNARAELDYLLSLPVGQGGVRAGQAFYLAHDLRPSSTGFVAEQGGRGGLMQALRRAVEDAGLRPVNLGALPTPALTAYALAQGAGSMMVTGSHIPFDRNGYKTNSARGELLKEDEAPINERVAAWRERLYAAPFAASPFDTQGRFKLTPDEALPPVNDAGRAHFLRRYTEFLPGAPLRGLRLVVYQHSAVGRDLLVELLRALGAEVIPAGRSETFVPIDTEAIDDAALEQIRQLAVAATAAHGPVDAVVSTDGDSDRPLLVGVDPEASGNCRARFFGGDLVGMVVAELLGADAVVVPISCNDAIDRGRLRPFLEPKTKIGSPHVIAGMLAARERGRRRVVGWEANGGFLTGSDLEWNGRVLSALPTRDAFLPIVGVLLAMQRAGRRMSQVFEALPRRFSRAALIRQFPRVAGLSIVAGLVEQRDRIPEFFAPQAGFSPVVRVDTTDGARIYFGNGEVAHVRPSGNADELRIYAVADTQARADEIAALATAEPEGILRRLARAFGGMTGPR